MTQATQTQTDNEPQTPPPVGRAEPGAAPAKRSAMGWVFEWADEKQGLYLASVALAALGALFKVLPYYFIARILSLYFNFFDDAGLYVQLALLAFASFAAGEILHSASTALSHSATFSVLAKVRAMCCDKLTRVPLGYVKGQPSGAFKNTLVERIDSIETTLAHVLPEFTANILASLAIFVYMAAVEWRLALFSLIPFALSLVFMCTMFIGYEPRYRKCVERTKELNDTAVEYVNGIEVIKVFGRTESAYDKFSAAARASADSYISWMRSCIVPQSAYMIVMPYALLTVLPIGAMRVAYGPLLTSDYILCVILSLGMATPLMVLSSYIDDIAKMNTVVGEVVAILEQPDMARPAVTAPENQPKGNGVALRDVRFAYEGGGEVLHGVSLDFPAGSVNALVGASGSGKSTIAKLIASYWDVQGGSVEIGGVDVRNIALSDANRLIAYVSQDTYLFNESVMDNIRQGRPDASDDEVRAIARESGCYDFIMGLEHGFDTVVGDAGGRLSGGERQRISIARAMLKDAPIVVLDEATAYTDPESEADTQQAISRLVKGKTLIMIAHRLSTVQNADRLFVIDGGRVAAQGTHRELLESCDIYRKMWNAHMSARDDDGAADTPNVAEPQESDSDSKVEPNSKKKEKEDAR